MAGRYVRRKTAKRITLDQRTYLTCRQGQWLKHQRVGGDVADILAGRSYWIELRISPQVARRMMESAGLSDWTALVAEARDAGMIWGYFVAGRLARERAWSSFRAAPRAWPSPRSQRDRVLMAMPMSVANCCCVIPKRNRNWRNSFLSMSGLLKDKHTARHISTQIRLDLGCLIGYRNSALNSAHQPNKMAPAVSREEVQQGPDTPRKELTVKDSGPPAVAPVPPPARLPQPVARCPRCSSPLHYNRNRSMLCCALGVSCGWVQRIVPRLIISGGPEP